MIFRNHPVSPLKQVRFCNVPIYAAPVTGGGRGSLLWIRQYLWWLYSRVRLSSSGMIFETGLSLHFTGLQFSEDRGTVFTGSLRWIYAL